MALGETPAPDLDEGAIVEVMQKLFSKKVMQSVSARLRGDPALMYKITDHFMAAFREVVPEELIEGQEDALRATIAAAMHCAFERAGQG